MTCSLLKSLNKQRIGEVDVRVLVPTLVSLKLAVITKAAMMKVVGTDSS